MFKESDVSDSRRAHTTSSEVAVALEGVQKAQNAPLGVVTDEIERVFGKNHIMYWVAVNESELSPTAASGSGAEGVFQITQGTWRNFKCSGTHFDYKANVQCAKKIYDANGLTDWRWSKYEGSQGGWAKHLSTSHGG